PGCTHALRRSENDRVSELDAPALPKVQEKSPVPGSFASHRDRTAKQGSKQTTCQKRALEAAWTRQRVPIWRGAGGAHQTSALLSAFCTQKIPEDLHTEGHCLPRVQTRPAFVDQTDEAVVLPLPQDGEDAVVIEPLLLTAADPVKLGAHIDRQGRGLLNRL